MAEVSCACRCRDGFFGLRSRARDGSVWIPGIAPFRCHRHDSALEASHLRKKTLAAKVLAAIALERVTAASRPDPLTELN